MHIGERVGKGGEGGVCLPEWGAYGHLLAPQWTDRCAICSCTYPVTACVCVWKCICECVCVCELVLSECGGEGEGETQCAARGFPRENSN